MYCSTCGAYLAQGRTHCTECGTQVARPRGVDTTPAMRFGTEDRRWIAERKVGVCPRCSYQGEGITYFSRGMHAAALVGATVLTSAAAGAGGLIYYLVRREHRVCPRCGKGWGRYGEKSLLPTAHAAAERPAAQVPRPGRGSAKRTWSVLMWVMAAILLLVAVGSGEVAPLLLAAGAGAGGWLLHRAAGEERIARRAALIAELQLPVLRLARERDGRLTVTEVAAALGWPIPRAEKVLDSLDDGLRVNSEVTDEGVIVYEFLELLHAPRPLRELEPGSDAEGRA